MKSCLSEVKIEVISSSWRNGFPVPSISLLNCAHFWPPEYLKGLLFLFKGNDFCPHRLSSKSLHLPSCTDQDPILNVFPELSGTSMCTVSASVGGMAAGELVTMLSSSAFSQDPRIHYTSAWWKRSLFLVGLDCLEKC